MAKILKVFLQKSIFINLVHISSSIFDEKPVFRAKSLNITIGKLYQLSVSLAQPSLPAKTHQIPAEAKATTAFIMCVSYKDKAYF